MLEEQLNAWAAQNAPAQPQAFQPIPVPNDQLQPGRVHIKPPSFTNAKGTTSWVAFRNRYENAAALNQWTDLTARQMLQHYVTGEAGDVTLDMYPQNYASLRVMLDAYQQVFLSEAESVAAVTEFENLRQGAAESALAYHGRCQMLFRRAHPGASADMANKLMMRQFIKGLRSQSLRLELYKEGGRITTLRELLKRVQTHYSALAMVKGEAANTASSDQPTEKGAALMEVGALLDEKCSCSINALTKKAEGPRCWRCQQLGHIKAECNNAFVPSKDGRVNAASGGRGKGGFQKGRGGKGSSGSGGRGRGRGKVIVKRLIAALAAIDLDGEDPDAGTAGAAGAAGSSEDHEDAPDPGDVSTPEDDDLDGIFQSYF